MKAFVTVTFAVCCACGAKPRPLPPGAWREPARDPAPDTSHWTRADEDRYMAAACANIVLNGHFRCDLLGQIFVADHCSETFHDMRDSARNERAQRALRLLLAEFAAAATCEDVQDALIRATAVLQAEPSG